MEKVLRVEDGKYIAGEVIGAEADLMTLLWENPSPNATFAAQTVNLDLSEYDFIEIFYKNYRSTASILSTRCPVVIGYIAWMQYVSHTSATATTSGTFAGKRAANITATGITFDSANYVYTGVAPTNNNDYVIPISIYGIKNKIQTIAKNVATTADKCMLSDGETSVEEALSEKYVYSYDECVVGKWVDGKTLYQKTVKFHTAAKSTDGYTAETIVLLNFPANVISFDGFLDSRAGGGQYTLPLNWPWFIGSDARTLLSAYVETRTNDTVLSILTNRHLEGDQDGYITIRYTKNT